MSKKLKVVAVSGSLGYPSRTSALIDSLLERIGAAYSIEIHRVELAEIAGQLGGVVSSKDLPAELARHIKAIETADVLVVASPVYRGSYTGLFKHLFDLVNHEALIDVPVLLAASGGSDRHALVIDHQLRPLFSFFQVVTLPIGVYATDADFTNYKVSNPALQQRIDLAVERALPLLHPRESKLSRAA